MASTIQTGRNERQRCEMPKRIQRKRTKGWRMPTNTVSVTRPGRWGNPYFPGCGRARGFFDRTLTLCHHDVRDPRVQVKWFGELMEQKRSDNPEEFDAYLAPLRGKDLACWCPLDQPCHADVLLELANVPTPFATETAPKKAHENE